MIISSSFTVEMEGDLCEWPLVDVAYWLHRSERTVAVGVRQGERISWLHFHNGRILHCEHRDLYGRAALASLLSTKDGTFFLATAFRGGFIASIFEPTEKLLLECAVEVDHQRRQSAPDEAGDLQQVSE